MAKSDPKKPALTVERTGVKSVHRGRDKETEYKRLWISKAAVLKRDRFRTPRQQITDTMPDGRAGIARL